MLGLAITLLAIALLILCAYRGVNLVLVAPVLAVLAVVFTDPPSALPAFTGIFMQRFADFMKLYFPTLLLGAAFGKAMEAAGLIPVIAAAVARFMGTRRAILAVVLLTALLTYGGVSVYVVAFAAYPFGALLFREAGIPKRLLPGVLLLGGGTFTMVSLPGTPQLPNLIPIPVLDTTEWAAPMLGLVASALTLTAGLAYFGSRAARLTAAGEGYGSGHRNEPDASLTSGTPLLLALLPLIVVIVANVALSYELPRLFGTTADVRLPGLAAPITVQAHSVEGTWEISGALLLGLLTVFAVGGRTALMGFQAQARTTVSDALLASATIASLFGFGEVLVALPGFLEIGAMLSRITDPLLDAVAATTVLAAMTGTASGALNVAADGFATQLLHQATAAGIPAEVLHRVMAVASGGLDTLPHNGAVITYLLVCGLTHRQAYPDMLALTLMKTVIGLLLVPIYYVTGLV